MYKIKNPLTGRPILVGGPTFNKLVKMELSIQRENLLIKNPQLRSHQVKILD